MPHRSIRPANCRLTVLAIGRNGFVLDALEQALYSRRLFEFPGNFLPAEAGAQCYAKSPV